MAVERAIKTIDFRRGSDGTGRVIVQLTDPRTPVNVRQEGNQVVVDFAGTLMPKNLMRRYDVQDFATPVLSVDALRVENSSRLVISAQGDFEQLAYQSDNQYTIEIKPSLKRANAEEKKEYTGERLTSELPGHRRALGAAAVGGHQRPEHRGERFGDRQSDPASAECALGSGPGHRVAHQGLDKRRQDNVIIIGPTEELANREKAELSARKEVQELSPVHSEFLQVNYAKVADLAKIIKADRAAKAPCCRIAAACRPTNAPTPCWSWTPLIAWPIFVTWCKPWTSLCGRC
jgi:type IV pilus assembly protein PilQ